MSLDDGVYDNSFRNLLPSRPAATRASPVVIDALAALGPVLLLEPAQRSARAFSGWPGFVEHCRPEQVQPRIEVDPDGIREELALTDRAGGVRFRLVRLPDSDYLGWERALCALGCCCSGKAAPGRVNPRAAIVHGARRREHWIARAVRLSATDGAAREPVPLDCGSWIGLRVIDRLREREDIALAP